jgi:hypothetical protein
MIMEPNNLYSKSSKPSIDEALKHYGEQSTFAPSFAARVQQRILAQQYSAQDRMITPFEAVLQEIWQLFPRFALAGVATAAVLMLYNISFTPESGVEWSLGDAFGVSAEMQELE